MDNLIEQKHANLVEDVKKAILDPVYGVSLNFSLEKAREWYDKKVSSWHFSAYEEECERFEWGNDKEMQEKMAEATNLFISVKNMSRVKNATINVYTTCAYVERERLKTFEEYLDEWLSDALKNSYENPAHNWALILERELWVKVTDDEAYLFSIGALDEDSIRICRQIHPTSIPYDEDKALKEVKHILFDKEENNGRTN